MSPTERLWRRIALLLLAPVWVGAAGVLAAARMLTGHRPVVALHHRVGHQRRPLIVPKLATTSIASNPRRLGGLVEIADGPPLPVEADGRLAEVMRRTGLDELPQIALIVTGRMRLVGPRPITPHEMTAYDNGERLAIDEMAPGLLGVWQVLDRHHYELDERCELDQWMVEQWSPRLERAIVVAATKQLLYRARHDGEAPSARLPGRPPVRRRRAVVD